MPSSPTVCRRSTASSTRRRPGRWAPSTLSATIGGTTIYRSLSPTKTFISKSNNHFHRHLEPHGRPWATSLRRRRSRPSSPSSTRSVPSSAPTSPPSAATSMTRSGSAERQKRPRPGPSRRRRRGKGDEPKRRRPPPSWRSSASTRSKSKWLF